MQTLLNIRLPPDSTAPSIARLALRSCCADSPGLATLELLVSELVTNSVRHASLSSSDLIALTVREDAGHLRVEVSDPGRGHDEASAAWSRIHDGQPSGEPSDQGGYGFLIVSRLADRAGVSRDEGTVSWFEIDDVVSGRLETLKGGH